MKVKHLQLLRGATQAEGVAVVIDVFRASSNIVTMFAQGVDAVVPADSVEKARNLKAAHPDWILAGEREGVPPEGFEMGNSPHETAARDLSGRTVILATSAGTRGLVAAGARAEETLVGCFLNASAVLRYIQNRPHEVVSFVTLGVCGEVPSPEDNFCAQYMELGLTPFPPDPSDMFLQIREHPEGRKFADPANPNYIPEDLDACLRLDAHAIVPRLDSDGKIRAAG